MKYVLVVLGGGADRPVNALYGKTPLQAAHLPLLDTLAQQALIGSATLLPEGAALAPEAASLALLGYDPARHYTGPAPLDATGRAVPLEHGDVAFRLDLVSSDGETLTDPAAGKIHGADAEALFQAVADRLRTLHLRFYPGQGRRNLLVWRDGPDGLRCLYPGEAAGKPLAETLPQGDGEAILHTLFYDSLELLDAHEINDRRRDAGLPPANAIWPWGQGRSPVLSQFAARRGLSGAVLSPFAYWRGLASLIGLRAPELPGATGRIETDYEGKAREAIAVLGTQDFVVIHVGGPGAASARGDAEEKVDALERIDARLLTPLLAGVKKLDDFRLMVVPDVAFPVEERTLVRDPVPFLLYASRGITRRVRAEFAESAVAEAPLRVEEGYRLIELLLKEEGA